MDLVHSNCKQMIFTNNILAYDKHPYAAAIYNGLSFEVQFDEPLALAEIFLIYS